MQIKRATVSDIDGLVENRMNFIYSIKNIRPPKSFEDLTLKYIKENMENGSLAAWIAIEGKEIVSSCILCITEQLPLPISSNGKIGYVYNVFTIPEYRRKGLALQVLGQMKEYAINNGITLLNLTATDDGLNLYKKAGFELVEREMRLSLQVCPAKRFMS